MSPAAQQISAYLITLCVPAAITFAAMLAARALHFAAQAAKAKTAAAQAGSVQAHTFAALEVLADCAADAVLRVESTMRPDIKGAAADGKISAEEGARLKAAAIAMAKEQAMAAAPKVLEAAGLSALDTLLDHLVEAAAAKYAGSSRQVLAATENPR